MRLFIIILLILLTVACVLAMLICLHQSRYSEKLTLKQWIIFPFAGVFSFVADTIGVGSFAVNIAIARTFKIVEDSKLPAFVNGAQVIPGAIAAVLFLNAINVDIMTLFVLVFGAALGGFIGGIWASKVQGRILHLLMIIAFASMIILLFCSIYNIIPVGGSAVYLTGWKLAIGFLGMVVAGFLSCLGVGLFAVVQAVLFVLGVSPVIAFPIMTAAGAIQQPITVFSFLFNRSLPIKKCLIVGIFGTIGVAIGYKIVSNMTTNELHGLLIIIIAYNVIGLLWSYIKAKN